MKDDEREKNPWRDDVYQVRRYNACLKCSAYCWRIPSVSVLLLSSEQPRESSPWCGDIEISVTPSRGTRWLAKAASRRDSVDLNSCQAKDLCENIFHNWSAGASAVASSFGAIYPHICSWPHFLSSDSCIYQFLSILHSHQNLPPLFCTTSAARRGRSLQA